MTALVDGLGNSNDRASQAAGARWLSLAASPVFGLTATWTEVVNVGPASALCSAAHPSPIAGISFMYLLMGAAHNAPRLRLLSSRRTMIDPADRGQYS